MGQVARLRAATGSFGGTGCLAGGVASSRVRAGRDRLPGWTRANRYRAGLPGRPGRRTRGGGSGLCSRWVRRPCRRDLVAAALCGQLSGTVAAAAILPTPPTDPADPETGRVGSMGCADSRCQAVWATRSFGTQCVMTRSVTSRVPFFPRFSSRCSSASDSDWVGRGARLALTCLLVVVGPRDSLAGESAADLRPCSEWPEPAASRSPPVIDGS